METWLRTSHAEASNLMARAGSQTDTITPQELTVQEEFHRDILAFDRQLHVLLASLVDQASEAFHLVKGAEQDSGVDAWRRLVKRYDPSHPQANMVLLKRVLHPKTVDIDKLLIALDK